MTEPQTKSREIAWNEWFPWLILVRSVRVALMARVMVLGALGLIAMTLGWRAIGWVFPVEGDPVIREWHQSTHQWLWDKSLEFSLKASVDSAAELFVWAADGLPKAPVSLWLYLTRPFMEMFGEGLTAAGFLHLLLCGLWELLVWGIAGGAISRIAALKLTRDEAPGFIAALKYAMGKVMSYSMAPVIALAGAGVFAIQLVALGWLMRLSFVAMLAGLAWPFVLLLGLLMAVLLIGALVGWPLMWATVSVEGTDAFDALSRSYAYTYHRPWRMLWYVLFAAFLAAVSMFVVKLFAASAIELGNWSVDWGLDDGTMNAIVKPEARATEGPILAPPAIADAVPVEEPATPDAGEPLGTQPGTMLRIAAWAIEGWKFLVNALAAGYQAGFLWVSAVAVYLLLRRDIDGVEMNEVFSDRDEEFGMPPLADDMATGVPEVSTGDSAIRGDTGSTT